MSWPAQDPAGAAAWAKATVERLPGLEQDRARLEADEREARKRRDVAIREAVEAGATVRQVAEATGLGKSQVANIAAGNPGGR